MIHARAALLSDHDPCFLTRFLACFCDGCFQFVVPNTGLCPYNYLSSKSHAFFARVFILVDALRQSPRPRWQGACLRREQKGRWQRIPLKMIKAKDKESLKADAFLNFLYFDCRIHFAPEGTPIQKGIAKILLTFRNRPGGKKLCAWFVERNTASRHVDSCCTVQNQVGPGKVFPSTEDLDPDVAAAVGLFAEWFGCLVAAPAALSFLFAPPANGPAGADREEVSEEEASEDEAVSEASEEVVSKAARQWIRSNRSRTQPRHLENFELGVSSGDESS